MSNTNRTHKIGLICWVSLRSTQPTRAGGGRRMTAGCAGMTDGKLPRLWRVNQARAGWVICRMWRQRSGQHGAGMKLWILRGIAGIPLRSIPAYGPALQKWLDANPNASSSDRSAAQNVLRDLQNALQGK